jgi:hypothetical protein
MQGLQASEGCGLRVASKKGHRAWGTAHRARHSSMEGEWESIKGHAFMYDWLVERVE